MFTPTYDNFGGLAVRSLSPHPVTVELEFRGVGHLPARLFFVFQQGKVGSQTIEASLRKILPVDYVERHHFLSLPEIQRTKKAASKVLGGARGDAIERYYTAADGLLSQAIAAEAARDKIEARMKGEPSWIITGIREPIATSVAYFFQNISTFCPDLTFQQDKLDDEVQRALSFYSEVFQAALAGGSMSHVAEAAATRIMVQPDTWFKGEFKRVTGVDIFEAPLDESGFCVFQRKKAYILLYRFEALPAILPKVISAAGLKYLRVPDVNVGREKVSGRLYSEFKRRFVRTPAMEEYFLDTDFAKRFYPAAWRRATLVKQIALTRSDLDKASSARGKTAATAKEFSDRLTALEALLSQSQTTEDDTARALAQAQATAENHLTRATIAEQQVSDLRAQLDSATSRPAPDESALEAARAKSAADLAAAQALADGRAAQITDLQQALTHTQAESSAQAEAKARDLSALQHALAQSQAESAAQAEAKAREVSALQQALAQSQAEGAAHAEAKAREVSALQQALAQSQAENAGHAEAKAREVNALQAALAQAQTESAAQAESKANEIGALQQALARAQTENAAQKEAQARELRALQQALAQAQSETSVRADAAAHEISALQKALAQALADAATQADAARAATEQAEASHVRATRDALAQAEASAAAAKVALEALARERDELHRALGVERALSAESIAQRDALNHRIGQMRAELDSAQKSLRDTAAAHATERAAADARYDEWMRQIGVLRAEELAQVRSAYEQRIAQLRAEADDAHNALCDAAAAHAAERAAADARYDELARQIEALRTEERAQVSAQHAAQLAQFSHALQDAEQIARQLDAERDMHVLEAQRLVEQLDAERAARRQEAERAQRLLDAEQHGLQTAQAERARREAAEGILEALENETVERERRIAALESALAQSQLAAAEATAARDAAAATYAGIVENSRYLKARRALMRLLGRS